MSFDEWTQEQAHRLAQTIAIQYNDSDHSACLDALEAYIAAQLAHRDYAALFPVVAQHLDSCVACAASYALVYEARVVDTAALAQINIPEPDLGFLQPSRALRLQRRLAEAVERIAPRQLRLTLSQPLLDLFLPPPTTGLALRSVSSDAPLLTMTLDQLRDQEIQIQLSVYQEREADDLCTLRTQLALADREWPDLAGISVAIRSGSTTRRVITDPWGEAVFSDVPKAALADLQIEVDGDSPPQTNT